MKEAIAAMLRSKTFLTAIVALILQIAGRYGLALDQGTVTLVISPLLLYIVAQGFADHGATAARIASQVTTTTTVDAAGTVPTTIAEVKATTPAPTGAP